MKSVFKYFKNVLLANFLSKIQRNAQKMAILVHLLMGRGAVARDTEKLEDAFPVMKLRMRNQRIQYTRQKTNARMRL